MTDHTRICEIVQKVFNAGQAFEAELKFALEYREHIPAAYPVITPLVEELVNHTADQQRCAFIEGVWTGMGHRRNTISQDEVVELAEKTYPKPTSCQAKPVRPSSPFRSVEIVDGELK